MEPEPEPVALVPWQMFQEPEPEPGFPGDFDNEIWISSDESELSSIPESMFTGTPPVSPHGGLTPVGWSSDSEYILDVMVLD